MVSHPAQLVWQRTKYSDVIEDNNIQRDKKYVDKLKLTARAGDGGKGCVSFWRSAAKGMFSSGKQSAGMCVLA